MGNPRERLGCALEERGLGRDGILRLRSVHADHTELAAASRELDVAHVEARLSVGREHLVRELLRHIGRRRVAGPLRLPSRQGHHGVLVGLGLAGRDAPRRSSPCESFERSDVEYCFPSQSSDHVSVSVRPRREAWRRRSRPIRRRRPSSSARQAEARRPHRRMCSLSTPLLRPGHECA